ncbi:uncharacterized protein LOC132700065 [Cylas formicarius]|uniref:uncharacterized protein LOC132700065 n=1 Tax=Cylas formicarius TaxID=197179 RepID=UPI0029583713|nr:uncharacterized protein LOC132700065 [Cylas formicarius]
MVEIQVVRYVIFSLLLSLGHTLECYTCSGQLGIPNMVSDCEQFSRHDDHKKSICLPGEQVCAKYIVHHDGMRWVHRSCKPFDICTVLKNVYNNGRDQLIECTTCSDRNLCNSADILYRYLYIYMTLIALILVQNM